MLPSMLLSTRVVGTASLQPGRLVTTAEVAQKAMPDRSAADLERKTGIKTRAFSGPEDTTAGLGARVLRMALDDANMQPSDLRRIILVSSTGGDFLIPATVNSLMEQMEIRIHAPALTSITRVLAFSPPSMLRLE